MIRADEIEELVSRLQYRGVSFWHACQFRDFQAYLALGSIPSRAMLSDSGSTFTAFETDAADQTNGVWDKVFLNLSDFGCSFANGGNALPNPYGPIVLKIHPVALLDAIDIAVCLRSAGSWQFDRQSNALKSVDEIDFLFQHSAEAPLWYRPLVKFQEELRKKYPKAETPEVSCTLPHGRLSIQHVEMAYVDPYRFPDGTLHHFVDSVRQQHGVAFGVQERSCKEPTRARLYNELASLALGSVPALIDLSQNGALSQNLRIWCKSIIDLEWQFKRFTSYLRQGTLLPILAENKGVS
jgi:hypothetical protein